MTNRKLCTISCVVVSGLAFCLLGSVDGQVFLWQEQLKSPHPNVRVKALIEIHKVGSQLEWAREYRTGGFFPEEAKAEYKRLLPVANRAIPLVIQALSDDEELVRIRAARALSILAIQPEKVVSALNGVLAKNEPSSRVREESIYALAAYGESALPALGEILKCANDTSAEVRLSVAYALNCVGIEKKETHSAIEKLLEDNDKTTRFSAIKAAEKRKNSAVYAIPILKKWISDDDPVSRRVAAESLAIFGADEPEIIDELRRLAKEDENAEVRAAADVAIEKLSKPKPSTSSSEKTNSP